MAGGVGTGLFVRGLCLQCEFDESHEVDFPYCGIPTQEDIDEGKDSIRSLHRGNGCAAKIAIDVYKGVAYRRDADNIAVAFNIVRNRIVQTGIGICC